jgi:PAS domain S-box-containing protein
MKKRRILITEDEPVIGMDIQSTLKKLGYDVPVVVSTGEEALERAEELQPDLILMDIVLPGKMDGIDAARYIKERYGIPIIFVTAHSEAETFERARETEPYGYLIKPVGKSDLYTAIETALHRSTMESQIRESEEKYRTIIDTIEDGYYEVDLQGNFQFANDTFCSIHGIPRDELISSNYRQYLDEENAKKAYQIFNNVYMTKIPKKSLDWEIIRRDGNRRFIEYSISLITNSRGTIEGFRGIVRDITERKRIEHALLESEAKARALINAPTDTVILIDRMGIIHDANERAIRNLGDNAGQIIGLNIYSMFSSEIAELRRGQADKVFDSGKPVRFEEEREGVWFDTVVYPIFDEFGKVPKVAVIAREITDQKLSDKALRESEEKYRLLADHVTDVIWIMDMDLKFTYISPSVERLSGYTVEDLENLSLKDIQDPEELERSSDYIERDLASEQAGQLNRFSYRILEHKLFRKDGIPIWVEDKMTFLRDKDGQPIGILGITRDITMRKEAEEKIKASLSEKENLLKEIHHRVKNNLQIISSMLRLQESRIKDEGLIRIFMDSRNRIRSMALIHERLYKSDNIASIDFAEYINLIVTELHQTYSYKPAQITLEMNVDRIFLGIDQAIPCGLIISELVSNAMKYAFPRELGKNGKIRITFHKKGKKTIQLMVEDDGTGIPDYVDINKVDSLGLQMVNLLTEKQLKGNLKLNRKRGTQFTITFSLPENSLPSGIP